MKERPLNFDFNDGEKVEVTDEQKKKLEKSANELEQHIGRKFSKQFALNKQAQRVDYTEGQEPAVPSGDDNSQTRGGGTTGGELEG